LFVDDLSFEYDEMPPERPLTDPTPLSHIIQRQTIIKVAAEIYDATEAGPPSSATIAAPDAKLERAIDSILERSKYRPLETSIADNPVTILHRIFMDILITRLFISFIDGASRRAPLIKKPRNPASYALTLPWQFWNVSEE
jgi:hypothetical protein